MQNKLYMKPAYQAAFERFGKPLQAKLHQNKTLCERDIDIFMLRLERYFADFYESFERLYGTRSDFEEQLGAIGRGLVETFAARKNELKQLDLEREITPDWFERETMIGGIYYVDLFAGDLKGISQHLNYLRELGLNYIHLMPLLKPRPAPNDGGYAVEDYCQVNPELGTMTDLENLAGELRNNGMSLCVDLVVNHTAKEHEWARQAMDGDPVYLDYYLTFDDRTLPNEYEKTLPEVFPDFKPGNFTYYPQMAHGKGKWVWTTFNEYQWDLNYTNPAVFRGMLDYMWFLANKGVDILRLDAVPFMWKRLGTDSQNQPEVHDLLQAFRALVRIAAPAVIFKAEAIVPPHHLIHYLGLGRHTGRECEIAYNNSLMVLIWSALASRKVALMTYTLRNMQSPPPGSTWVTYVRLHDDIGWAITDENAAAVGENAFAHRNFLNEFYEGRFPGSFSRGEIFQYNPATGDGRMSGMTASMAGLEKALEEGGDFYKVGLAIRRILLLYSVAFSYGGIPLVYSGDEIGLLNDYSYRHNPYKAADNRWVHRPAMNWELATHRHDESTVAGRIFAQMRQLVEARKAALQLHGSSSVEAIWTGNDSVFGYVRQHPAAGRLVALCNFSENDQYVNSGVARDNGLNVDGLRDIRQLSRPAVTAYDYNFYLKLEPYQTLWLVNEPI